MEEATTSNEGIIVDILKPILPKIGGELTWEGLIKLHQLVRGDAVSMSLKLGGGRHGHLTVTMKSEEYMAHTGFAFVMSYNLGNYPTTNGNGIEQALRTDEFQQNQVLFQKYTAVDQALKK